MSVPGIPKKTTRLITVDVTIAQDLAPAGAVMGGSREGPRFAQSIKVKVAASYKAQLAVSLLIKRITQDYSV